MSTDTLDQLTDAELSEVIWDSLRTVACSTGTKAHRIVLVTKGDIDRATALIRAKRAEKGAVA
jgi:hypothetical protein